MCRIKEMSAYRICLASLEDHEQLGCKDGMVTFAKEWMAAEIIMLNKVRHTHKDSMYHLMYRI